MSRQKKLQQKARYQVAQERRRIDAFQDVLTALGVGDWFRCLRTGHKVAMSKVIIPPPKIEFDPSVMGDSTAQKIAALIADTFATPDATLQLTPTNWFSVGPVLRSAFERLRRESLNRHDAYAYDVAFKTVSQTIKPFSERMSLTAANTLAACVCLLSDVEKGSFWYELSPQLPMVITLGRVAPETIHVSLDGSTRLAYRCAAPLFGTRSVTWLAWPNKDGKGRIGLPIYIQSHAILRLHERVNLGGWDTVGLMQSLLTPNVIREEGDDIWIEYAILDNRLGYFIARQMADKILVRTFLFLTMEPAPEYVLLRERLRIRRPDIAYNRLDRLDTFAATDIRNDRSLCDIFAECNCGHLTTIPEELVKGRIKIGVARELKQYLGIEVPVMKPHSA
jgi:hypothetical protein